MDWSENDRRLLRFLQSDCSLSNAELAERVGLSASVCWRRVRGFEEAGIIERYRADVSPTRVGLQFQAMVHVQLTRHNPTHLRDFIAAIEHREEILECYATTGKADYHLRVLCRDIDHYNRFLEGYLFQLPAVESAQTNVVLREIKRSGVIPV